MTSTPPITHIAIPTKDRPASLGPCVASFQRNLDVHNRTAQFIIADDSRDEASSDATKSVIPSEAVYVDRPFRARLAGELAEALNINPSITHFALLGANRFPTHGATRNTLLLLTAGHISLQSDDDIQCRLAPSPNYELGCQFLTFDPNHFWYFPDLDATLEAVPEAEVDLLGLHEQLLGRHMQNSLGAELNANLQHTDKAFMARMLLPDARVVCTFLGIAGDAGMDHHAFRLYQDDAARIAMMQDAAAYELGMTTRWMIKAVPQQSIGSAMGCMAGHMAIDGRQSLPPFFPVLRNEDGVWGMIRTLSFPQYFSGYLPYTVLHQPEVSREVLPLVESLRPTPLRVSDLVVLLAWTFLIETSGRSLSLAELGEAYTQTARLSEKAFAAKLLGLVERQQAQFVKQLHSIQAAHPGAGTHWQKGMAAYIEAEATRLEDAAIPDDLKGSKLERLQTFQELVGQYGAVLTHWQSMADAVSQLRSYKEIH